MTSHNGVCGFCGSPVPKGFTVCSHCGATWKKVEIGLGGFVFDILKVPISIAFVAGLAWFLLAQNPAGLALAGIALAVGFIAMQNSQSWRWVRPDPTA